MINVSNYEGQYPVRKMRKKYLISVKGLLDIILLNRVMIEFYIVTNIESEPLPCIHALAGRNICRK